MIDGQGLDEMDRAAVLADANEIAEREAGGTLATMHAEDGTPYVTFVFFALQPDGSVLFGSGGNNQHARNMAATPEVSFLIDNRQVIGDDWSKFNRLVVEGRAEAIPSDDLRYPSLLESLREKNSAAAYFTERGTLYRIEPRRYVLMKGFEQKRVFDFARNVTETVAAASVTA